MRIFQKNEFEDKRTPSQKREDEIQEYFDYEDEENRFEFLRIIGEGVLWLFGIKSDKAIEKDGNE